MKRATPADRLQPGDRVDDFVVVERAHVGAQSVLYHVTGRDPGFPMLMKVPLFAGGDPAQNLLSYETEANIVPALSGPHVPRFVAAGDIRRVPYLVMERVEGKSLETLLERCPLPADEVARIGAAVADAVHRLHQQKAVHCDLKPENVILRPDGRAVLIDFGLAWHTRFPDLHAEEERHAAGSLPFLSPEQILGVRGDRRSDVFSLGVLLYELATGELPFGMPSTKGGLRQRLWMDPQAPAALAKTVTPVLQEIILHCIEPDVEKRYQSAALVAFDLRNPEQVPLTARASKTRSDGFLRQTRRWWNARVAPILPPPQVKRTIDASPVVMVAVDTTHPDDERQPAIQRATRRFLSLSSEFRLVCVSVISAAPIGGGQSQADHHLEHLVRLRNWTEPLPVPSDRLSQHVIESPDPAAALLDFARRNHVDLIILGAPGPHDQALAWWRSVASGVTANAHCSVYVVRVPDEAEPDELAPATIEPVPSP